MAEFDSTDVTDDIGDSSNGHEELLTSDIEFNCNFCEERFKQPKILSCLHVFCAECVKKIIDSAVEGKEDEAALRSKIKSTITCPTCQQTTSVAGIDALPTDHVTINMMEILAIKDKKVVCTSCKSQQTAVARCCDCANFLCPICVNAHQYMRCFENHKVVSFDDMKEADSVLIHKPLFCPVHSSEHMKYFCNTCQVPICNECMVTEHQQPTHHYDRMAAIEMMQIAEIKELVKKCRGQLSCCDEATQSLEGCLSELQMQRDNARGLIEESYQTYRAMLEKMKVQMLESLEDMHTRQELKVMEMLHGVEKTAQRVEDGTSFAERVLKNGSTIEILLMKRLIIVQLQSLLRNIPSFGDIGKIEFVTDENSFRDAVTKTFGHLKVLEPKQQVALQQIDQMSAQHEPSPIASHGTDSSPTYSLEVAAAFARELGSPINTHVQQPMVTANDILASLPSLTFSGLMGHSAFAPMSDLVTLDSGSSHSLSNVGGSLVDLPLERSQSRELPSPSNLLDGVPVGGTAIVGRSVLGSYGDLQASMGSGSLGLTQATNGHHISQDLNTDALASLTQSLNMSPMINSDASLQTLLNSLSSQSQTPALSDLSALLNSNQQSLNNTFLEASNLLSQSGHSMSVSASSNSGNSLSPGIGGSSFNQPAPVSVPFPIRNAKKVNAMQIRCKFGQQGQGYGQFNSPHGFCLGMDDDIVVADTMNHRIEVFDKSGEHKYQFGIPGKEEGQLWYPRKVAVIRQTGKYIVCDRGNERSRMQIFLKNGHFVKKIAIRYIDIVAGLAISPQGHIVAVDSVTPTVFCIAESGDLVRWFDCSDYMREPSDIAISGKEYFVCDFKGHCVVVFTETGEFLRRIGSETITTFPNGIDISDAGDILIGDSHGNRFHVAVFQRTGSLVGEFECPYIKVSRCCGLKITSEGYIVTLAKNNHYVLVLNTLYIA